jgi:putative transposase
MRGFRLWRGHLDEVFVRINGERHYLWRAVGHEGEILESFVDKKRDKSAALVFLRNTLKRHGRVKAIVTDVLRSYPAVMRELGNLDRREIGRWKNNRVENSNLPFRRMKTLHKFVLVHASLRNHFNHERHLVDRQTYKTRRAAALADWQTLAA